MADSALAAGSLGRWVVGVEQTLATVTGLRVGRQTVVILSLLVGVVAISTQDKDLDGHSIVPLLEADQLENHKLLAQLFDWYESDVFIQPDVAGTVTMYLRNVKFGVALENIVRQIDATYQSHGGKFEVLRRFRSSISDTPTAVQKEVRKPSSRRAELNDGEYTFVVVNNTISKIPNGASKSVSSNLLKREIKKTSINLATPSGRELLKKAARSAELLVDIHPAARGNARIEPGEVSLESLSKLFGNAYTDWKDEKKSKEHLVKISKYAYVRPVGFTPMPPVYKDPTIRFDHRFLVVTLDRWMYRVRPSDLSIESFSEVAN